MKIKTLTAVFLTLISASAMSASYGVNNYATSNANAHKQRMAADKAKLDMAKASLTKYTAYYNQNCSFGQKTNMCNYLRDGGLRNQASALNIQAAQLSKHYNQPSLNAQYGNTRVQPTLNKVSVPGYGNKQSHVYTTTYAVKR